MGGSNCTLSYILTTGYTTLEYNYNNWTQYIEIHQLQQLDTLHQLKQLKYDVLTLGYITQQLKNEFKFQYTVLNRIMNQKLYLTITLVHLFIHYVSSDSIQNRSNWVSFLLTK